ALVTIAGREVAVAESPRTGTDGQTLLHTRQAPSLGPQRPRQGAPPSRTAARSPCRQRPLQPRRRGRGGGGSPRTCGTRPGAQTRVLQQVALSPLERGGSRRRRSSESRWQEGKYRRAGRLPPPRRPRRPMPSLRAPTQGDLIAGPCSHSWPLRCLWQPGSCTRLTCVRGGSLGVGAVGTAGLDARTPGSDRLQ
ncbi:hypothetical protein P7K49_011887, partial [Saguinus oedipus]